MTIQVVTTDITHPSVSAISYTIQARGSFPDHVREIFNAWAIEHGLPRIAPVGLSTALKRAMQSLANGPSRELKAAGRKSGAVYTLITLDLTRADREESDGLGIGNAEVSARIQVDPNVQDSFWVKVSPEDHPAAEAIREAFDHHCGTLSAVYDVKTWLRQQALSSIGAFCSPDAAGRYWIHAKESEALVALRDVCAEASKHGDGMIKLHCMGHTGEDTDAVDLLTDALMDECARTIKTVDGYLSAEDKKMGRKGLASKKDEVTMLRARLAAFADSFGMSLEDTQSQLVAIDDRIAHAALQLSGVEEKTDE